MVHIKQLSRLVPKTTADKSFNWFPGHMYAGMKAMIGKLATVDCVIEVHDARIPLTGRNAEFQNHLGAVKPRVLVLNKSDLADLSQWDRIKTELDLRGDKDVVLTDLSGHLGSTRSGPTNLMKTVVAAINRSDRHNRASTNNFKVMIVGIPNVGKSTLINRLRQYHLGREGEPASTGKMAGVTKKAGNQIKICSRPPVYSIDTPGVLKPGYAKNRDQLMRLALCASIRDELVDPVDLASYLLNYLNELNPDSYTNALGLKEPVKTVEELYHKALSQEAMSDAIFSVPPKNFSLPAFCWFVIKEFRRGKYGKVMFD